MSAVVGRSWGLGVGRSAVVGVGEVGIGGREGGDLQGVGAGEHIESR